MEYDEEQLIRSRGIEPGGKVQQFIDTECLRLCEPYVPKDVAAGSQGGALIQSGIIHTKIGSGQLEYRTLYARRWYYMPAKFQGAPQRGNYWFERMKQKYREQILAGARREAGISQ